MTPERIIGNWYSTEHRIPKDPVELDINDEALSKRGIDKIVGLYREKNWKAFYAAAQKILQVKPRAPIMKALTDIEGNMHTCPEEVARMIAEGYRNLQ